MVAQVPPLPQPDQKYSVAWANRLVFTLNQFITSLRQAPVEFQDKLTTRRGRNKAVTLVTSASYQALSTDHIIDVNRAEAVAVTLPANPSKGDEVVVQDSSGGASSYNITISPSSGNVNGGSNVVISTDYGRLDFYYNGTQWLAG